MGKVLGKSNATKGGIGTASVRLGNITIGAIAVVNAFGDVIDPDDGKVLAGPRDEKSKSFLRTEEILGSSNNRLEQQGGPSNTTLAIVATDARLNKEQANKLAQVGQDGLAIAVRPCHSMGDGDVVFALATGKSEDEIDMRQLCSFTSQIVAKAIVRGAVMAKGLGGVPSAKEFSLLS